MDYFDYLLSKNLEEQNDPQVEPLTITENGRYSEEGKAYTPVNVDVYQPTLETLNADSNDTYTAPSGKAYNKVNVNVPLPDYYTKEDLPTGSISTFTDGVDLPLNSLKVSIEAVQDLHGYDKPWPAGGGKNKLPMILADIKSANTIATWSGNVYVIDGVTFTVITDNADNVIGIHVNGLATNTVYFHLRSFPTQNNINYSVNGAPIGGDANKYWLIVYTSPFAVDYGNGANFIGDGSPKTVDIVIVNGYNAQDLTFYPMIRLATVTDPTFAPYSNICPITGWDNVTITDKDDINNPTVTKTTTIPLSSTCYGGEFSVDTGMYEGIMSDKVNLGNYNWVRLPTTQSGKYRFASNDIVNPKRVPSTSATPNLICSAFNAGSLNSTYTCVNGITISDNQDRVIVYCDDYAEYTPEQFKSAVNGVELTYELATPTTTQIAQPTAIRTLEGDNNLWADCGEVLDGEYFKGGTT